MSGEAFRSLRAAAREVLGAPPASLLLLVAKDRDTGTATIARERWSDEERALGRLWRQGFGTADAETIEGELRTYGTRVILRAAARDEKPVEMALRSTEYKATGAIGWEPDEG